MSDTIEAKLLGELAIVVIRAQHLSDRSKIGKHHPYVVLKYGSNSVKTPVVKKGGQHPTFDAEVRFKITEDAEDIITRQPDPNDKDATGPKKGRRIPKNKSMVLSVFADDPKDPKLVGETVVDLTTVFEKCEHDDMFELKYKEMFAGEIYLEMTYFINDAPPIPKKVAKPVSWMDYGTTGPLPSGKSDQGAADSTSDICRDTGAYAQGSSGSRTQSIQGVPASLSGPPRQDPHRRDSQPGTHSPYSQNMPHPGKYVPPPAFPGRQARKEPVGPMRPGSEHSVSGPPPMVSDPTSSSGFPTSADAYHQPYSSHSHRHSLPGAMPPYGHWQSDPVHQQAPATAPLGAPASTFQPIHGQPPPGSYPYQQSLPMQYPTDHTGAAPYTSTAPPSSSFPRLNDMAMALPTLPPPPLVELPGRTTPLPSVYGVQASTPRPSALPVPESYQYPPAELHPNPYPSQANAFVLPVPPISQPYGPPRPSSTHVSTYPLIDNRPPSSMGSLPPPDRPYSSASMHYPPTVTSSYHISPPPAVPAASFGSAGHWSGPAQGQYLPPANYASAYPEISRGQTQSPYSGAAGQQYGSASSQAYPQAPDHNQSSAYLPPAPTSAWTAPDANAKPGRSYIRSLGVGGSHSSNATPPPGAPLYYPPVHGHVGYDSDVQASWNSSPQHLPNSNYGHHGPPDPGFLPADMPYHSGQAGTPAFRPAYGGY